MTVRREATDHEILSDDAARALLAGAGWQRFAALGDSTAEGVREPLDGYRDLGWLDRLAAALDRPGLRDGAAYLNLGKRGLLAAEVRAQQLDEALAFAPDLAVVSAGGNDMLLAEFDGAAVEMELDRMVSALRAAGADVVTVGLFDISASTIVPERFRAATGVRLRELTARAAAVAARHRALHVELTSHPASADDGIYSSDRLHLNARGHALAASVAVRQLSAQLALRVAA